MPTSNLAILEVDQLLFNTEKRFAMAERLAHGDKAEFWKYAWTPQAVDELDTGVVGAFESVKALALSGFHIHFLSSRPNGRLYLPTLAQLRKLGFGDAAESRPFHKEWNLTLKEDREQFVPTKRWKARMAAHIASQFKFDGPNPTVLYLDPSLENIEAVATGWKSELPHLVLGTNFNSIPCCLCRNFVEQLALSKKVSGIFCSQECAEEAEVN